MQVSKSWVPNYWNQLTTSLDKVQVKSSKTHLHNNYGPPLGSGMARSETEGLHMPKGLVKATLIHLSRKKKKTNHHTQEQCNK